MEDQEIRVLRMEAGDGVEEADEAHAVLNALQALRRTVTIPVIQVCLDEACEDIAHLTSTGEGEAQAEKSDVA